MDIYTIKKAYHWTNDKELEITSNNLLYIEAGESHHGVQCSNLDNYNKILEKCKQIVCLIREIDTLNK